MISPKDKIEAAFDKASPKKLIFTDTKKNRRDKFLFVVIIVLGIPICFLQILGYQPIWIILSLLFWFLTLLSCFYFFVNPYAKNQLKKLGIESPNGFFKHWDDEKYTEYKLEVVYKHLVAQGILKNNENDIDILDQCQKIFEVESNATLKKAEFPFSNFLMAVIITTLTQCSILLFKYNDVDKATVLTLLIVVAVFFFIMAVRQFFLLFIDRLNKESNNYKKISQWLNIIKVNLLMRQKPKK
jgi:hypothetical protein